MDLHAVNASAAASQAGATGQAASASHRQETIFTPPQLPSDPVTTTAFGSRQSLFHELHAEKRLLGEVSRIFKSVEQTMDAIGQRLEAMKDNLVKIVKNFPPFPPGNEERLKLLKSFNALRQEIDSLTFPAPPDPEGARQIMADPAILAGGGGWQVTIEGSFSLTIAAQEVHSGLTGLNIPALPDSAGDEATGDQVLSALETLGTAAATLTERKAGLAADGAVLHRLFADLPAFHQINQDFTELGPDVASGEAVVAIRQEFSMNLTFSLSGGRDRPLLQNMFG